MLLRGRVGVRALCGRPQAPRLVAVRPMKNTVVRVSAEYIGKGETTPSNKPTKEQGVDGKNGVPPAPPLAADTPVVDGAISKAPKDAPAAPPSDALADLEDLKDLIDAASKAQALYADFTQEQVCIRSSRYVADIE
jgi:hypothetical protein